MRFVLKTIIAAVAIWLVTRLPLDMHVVGGDGTTFGQILVYLFVAAIFVAVTLLIKPIVDAITAPARWLTLGLFGLVVAWAMLWFTSWLTTKLDYGTLEIGGFWKTLLAALLISLAIWFLNKLVPAANKKKRFGSRS